jgi:hypothetical protein
MNDIEDQARQYPLYLLLVIIAHRRPLRLYAKMNSSFVMPPLRTVAPLEC